MKNIIFIILILIGLAFAWLIKENSKPINKTSALELIKTTVQGDLKNAKNMTAAQILIHSDKLNIHENYSFSKTNTLPDGNTPFHIASIGKTFTATLIGILGDRGQLSIEDPISKYLSEDILQGLFVFEGVDYQKQVTIEQLLRHTSGVADYFEDPVTSGPMLGDLIINDKDHMWTPLELLAFSRDKQKTFSAPGKSAHYSDTGYILLGLIIEKVSGKAFHENLSDEIFTPLGMADSYLIFYSEPLNQPKKPLSQIWFKGTEVSTYKSLSIDWSGGGIITTPEDLLKFYKALREGKLITAERLAAMEVITGKFRAGIHLGAGIMEVRFEEFFFLLKGMPYTKGHIGVLSTHMMYDSVHDTYIIANFGSTEFMAQSFQLIIKILSTLNRIS
jgi:D-alanyl-D-alanine carboxypeptidase